MDYEKKYKEALERAKKELKACGSTDCDAVRQIFRLFPELKENDDEKIKEALIALVKCNERNGYFMLNNVPTSSMISWLEKQGEQTPTQETEPFEAEHGKYYYCIKDYFCGGNKQASKGDVIQALRGLPIMGLKDASEYFLPVNIIKLGVKFPTNDCDDKQKPFDYENVNIQQKDFAPKFKVGDWIIGNEGIFKITRYEDEYGYELIGTTGYVAHFISPDYLKSNYHLWTIQDAKDGDVVVDKSDGAIGIFQSIGHHPNGGSCNDPSYCFLHCRYDDGFFYADFEHGNMIDSDDLIPATKEKRDLLFKKMHEAGYEWHALSRTLLIKL